MLKGVVQVVGVRRSGLLQIHDFGLATKYEDGVKLTELVGKGKHASGRRTSGEVLAPYTVFVQNLGSSLRCS